MKALVVHNFYRSANASGENLSVTDEIAGLRSLGWDVEVISADSDVIADSSQSLTQVALRTVHSSRSVRRTIDAIERFRPNVALIENLFPMHSPSVIRTLKRRGVPVAAGVRSYRMWCVASSMYRDGKPCNDCVGSVANFPAVRHGCYQDSALRSAPMAASLRLHRSTFRQIDAFLAVSEYVGGELRKAGMPADRIVVRPNFVPDPGTSPQLDNPDFVFAGRLTDEKGLGLMIEAWKQSEVWKTSRLRVAGSGPLMDLVTGLDQEYRVEALGLVDHLVLLDIVRASGVMVVPSMWPEPFGRGVIEAAALVRPSLVTNSGGLASLVVDGETGWITEPTVGGLAAGFQRASKVDAQRSAGIAARARFESNYTREISVGVLHDTLSRLALQGADLN
jgi:glycosyltransferase involved in cell wall biosynthesis